ncbi:MAG TPA: ATP-binding cassette domain-containing protein [Gemmatimonadaceae bacterium]|nr:ATP-binding cassette domain-containing protein [Gemmatimonadaceae bacterium]
MIDVEQLSVRVPGFTLDRATFTVTQGAVAVVTGPTGAGKTTLLETIAGVRAASGGRIHLDGRDVTRVPPEQRNVGLVYQQAWLFPHLSVAGNVSYGARDDSVVTTLIQLLRITPLLEKPVASLSGGERQLVAIARALARVPRTLLLDEPFAAMDSVLRGEIRQAVLEWAAGSNVTTMLVTHDTAEAALSGARQLRVSNGIVSQAG